MAVDLIEVTRSVVRIPVAGPAPNNTLVFVRGTVYAGDKQQRNHQLYHALAAGVSAYQIEGFVQSKAGDYLAHTRCSVAAFMRELSSDDDQDFVAAVDAIEGRLTSDGTFYVLADIATLIDQNILGLKFSFSAYILTQEPQPDFTRPPRRGPVVSDRATLLPRHGALHAAAVRPFAPGAAVDERAAAEGRRIIDCDCPPR